MFAGTAATAGEAGPVRLFDARCDAAWPIDVDAGRWVGVNRAASALPGDDAAGMKRLTPAAIHPHERPACEACLETVVAPGGRAAGDPCHRIPSNRARDGDAALATVRG